MYELVLRFGPNQCVSTFRTAAPLRKDWRLPDLVCSATTDLSTGAGR